MTTGRYWKITIIANNDWSIDPTYRYVRVLPIRYRR